MELLDLFKSYPSFFGLFVVFQPEPEYLGSWGQPLPCSISLENTLNAFQNQLELTQTPLNLNQFNSI